jgi:tetratricopeptide (TPR) repeat protein
MRTQRGILFCLALVACGGGTKAQAPAGPDPAEVAAGKEAARLFEEGKAAYAAGDTEKAIASWEAGYAAKPDPVFQYNLGQAQNKAGRPDKAAEHLRKYLELAPAAENRAQVEEALVQLDAAAAQEESIRLFDAGRASFDDGKYDEAIAQWEQGYAKRPSAVFLYNIGQAHRAAGRKEEARAALEKYLTEAPDTPHRATVEKMLKELAPRKKK